MAKTTTDKIGIDLKGRVNRLKLAERNMLLPLFEAIINSIHAIEDTKSPKGEINIKLIRSSQSSIEFEIGRLTPEIIGFEIEDNGIGFNEENYESFKREYSTHKAERGGLGIGRFMWLKAFYNVTIESIYYEGLKPQKRSFSFNLRTTDGIEHPVVNKLEGNPKKKTIITLNGYKDPYRSKCPKRIDTIANRIVEHCLIYFLNENCPNINLLDGSDKINLNNYFDKITRGNRFSEKFNVGTNDFKITLLKWFEHEELTFHRISLSANHREVENFNINKVLPDVSGKIKDSTTAQNYLIVGYIEGKYFDDNINDERTEIRFSKNGILDEELIAESDLYKELIPVIKKHFSEEVEKFKAEKLERISDFIAEKAPQYRILNKYVESFDDVVVTENTSEQELDLKLYRLLQDVEFGTRRDVNSVLTDDARDENADVLKQKYLKIFEELTDLNKSKLSQYVVHRKYILELFEKSLGLNVQGKYELEDTVHSIIYPTKTTSNEIDYNNQNLWILDERLSFHTFLSSDRALNTIEDFEGDPKDRPDLMIFNNPISYIEGDEAPFNSVVLVEFKRPMRKGYNEYVDNPIVQLYDYVRKIRNGKKLTADGRTYDINEYTRFYCYLICDINEKIIEYSENAQLEKTYDGLGYYGYNKSLKCVIDVMPFNQVLSNAKKRNKVLFNKLGI
ncbi:ATP-binding protein [Aequorivita sp. SDUM287046]|uniref:ATP-binding protein n=1 Tax=Aequorivita aurantiaca TaxID=3053356 RepID=A0ABT8DPY1_9FLAO|nr:ATP-binding protein [Aequorivita aurantiaca]MDN3725122.1 ATP-binding protein [Aequorivita aurantiaca]